MNGYLSEEALEAYSQLVAESLDLNFSEAENYDFTRCVRPNGTAYGTQGTCRQGTEQAKPTVEEIKKNITKQEAASQVHKKQAAKREESFDKGAQVYASMLKKDDPKRELKVRSMRNMIESLFKNGTQETARDIYNGDFNKVFKHLFDIQEKDKKSYVREKAAEARKESKDRNKEAFSTMLKSTDPKVKEKAKEDMKFYVDRDVQRMKVAAGREHDEAFEITRQLRYAREGK